MAGSSITILSQTPQEAAKLNPQFLVPVQFHSGGGGSILSILHAVDVTEVGTRNVCPSCDAHESLLRCIIHDG